MPGVPQGFFGLQVVPGDAALLKTLSGARAETVRGLRGAALEGRPPAEGESCAPWVLGEAAGNTDQRGAPLPSGLLSPVLEKGAGERLRAPSLSPVWHISRLA